MPNKLKAVIVDDERLARKDLISLLKEQDNIEVVAEAADVPSAIKTISEFGPDIIFLDIQMPGESGFDLLEKLKTDAKVIFVTAYDEYAIRAFEVNALDYLLKPVNPERLQKALERILTKEESDEQPLRELNYEDHLFLLLDNSMRFLKVNTILHISAAGDYSEIFTNAGNKHLVLKSMKEWEDRLPHQHFCRIHRSTIINLNHVDRLEEWFNYSYRVYLKNIREPFIMSRRYASKLKHKLC